MSSPALPSLPKSWTVSSALTLLGAVALYVIGALTFFGIHVPASVSVDTRYLISLIPMIAATIVTLAHMVNKNSKIKAGLAAGLRGRELSDL